MQKNGHLVPAALRQCFKVFSRSDRKKIASLALAQIILGAFDLLGLALIGMIGSLAISGIRSSEVGEPVNLVLRATNLENLTFQYQTAILAIVSTLLLVSRTLVSAYMSRKILFYIGRRSGELSSELMAKVLNQNLLFFNSKSIHEIDFAVSQGVSSISIGIVGALSVMIADISSLIVILVALAIFDPILAVTTSTIFLITFVILNTSMNRRALELGRSNTSLSIENSEKLFEVVNSFRELSVKKRLGFYHKLISQSRRKIFDLQADIQFLPLISKYVLEVTVFMSALLVAGFQFFVKDVDEAVAGLAIFMAASLRIFPAILRIQQGWITVKTNLGPSFKALEIIDELPKDYRNDIIPYYDDLHDGFIPNVDLVGLEFSYDGNSNFLLRDIDLTLQAGIKCAIVGRSGSGKSSLVELMIGMFEPKSGHIEVHGNKPSEIIDRYPGAIGYVPQEIRVYEGSVRDNVALGYPTCEATNERIWRALSYAQLKDFAQKLPNGIDSKLGPKGFVLSAGQKQRLGIARALFTLPKLLILDEATSSLDVETENQIMKSLEEIPYEITIVAIAHRLSSIKDFDRIIYLENGAIVASGNFSEVREKSLHFDLQAKEFGL